MSISGEEASDQRVKEKTDELRAKYPHIHCYRGKDSCNGFKRSC